MKITLNKILLFFTVTTIFATSCQKDKQEDNLNSGKGTVTLKIDGIGFSKSQNNSTKSSSLNKKYNSPQVQRIEVPFNEKYNVTATLTPINNPTSASLKASKKAESISNGEVIIDLQEGARTFVGIYEKGNRSKEVYRNLFIRGVNDSNTSIDLPSGEYTLILEMTSGTSGYINGQANPARLRKDFTVTSGQKVDLNLVAYHIFANVTVTLNAGNIGNIESIAKATIGPHYKLYPDGAGIDYFTGAVTYGDLVEKEVKFPKQTANSSWQSEQTVLQVKSTDKGRVDLTGVRINGISGSISLKNLIFEEGVKYNLQLTIGEKKEKTYKIAGLEFAVGNLKYNDSKDEYLFEETGVYYKDNILFLPSYDYFFPNYLKPRKMKQGNFTPQLTLNGNQGDPCKLVKPLNTWRLPKESEIRTLLAAVNAGTANQNTAVTPVGNNINTSSFYFGIRNESQDDRSNYLSLPFTGYYGSSDDGSRNLMMAGIYLLTTDTNGYSWLEVAPSGVKSGSNNNITYNQPGIVQIKGSTAYSGLNTATPIRCVKN